jgi:glucose/arabinose dehydrogenase
MKKFYLLVFISFFSGNIFAQNFTDPNFSLTTISDGWNQALGAAFSKDAQRLFVWEKAGLVYVCNKSGNTYTRQTTPVINLSAEVLNWMDHGLLGFALDPDYLTNGYIYLLYAVDRRVLMNDNSIVADAGFAATIGRVTRYRTILNGSDLAVDPSSRTILLGETKSTGIPLIHESHGLGTLAFAADGTLLLTAGDAGNFNGEDFGNNSETYYAQALADGIIRPQENVGAFRAQLLNSHNGKLLRIDPATGNGVASNPFYSAAEPRSAKSRVWSFGLRNPFRFIVRPGTGSTNPLTGDIGEIFIADVGWEGWEDFNIATGAGQNFGWPIYEGHDVNSRYATYAATTQNGDEPNPLAGGGCARPFFTFRELIKDPTPDGNTTIYNPCNASVVIGTGNRYVHRRPSLDYGHQQNSSRVGIFSGNNPVTAEIGTPASGVAGAPFKGYCAVAGIWYTGNDFPPEYKDKFFMADWASGWIKRISIDFTDVVTRVDNFVDDMDEIVCMVENPVDGTVVIIAGWPHVMILDYGGNQPPVAKPVANITYGSSPLTVNFTGNTSYDLSPGGSIVSYSWNFGGGVPATANVANPGNVVFTDASGNPKKFVAKLTVTDNGGATHTDSVIISVNNTPPVVNITSPINNSTYKPGSDTTYLCTANVTDNEHGPAQLKYEWQTFLRHNIHQHAGVIDNNVNTATTISRIGCNGDTYYWFIKLKVTDAAGLFAIDSAKLFPDCIVGPDITPPTVSSVSPVNAATGINTGTTITATFNEAINPSTVTGTTFRLKDASNNVVGANVSVSANQIILTPSAPLTSSTVYTATITSGASGVADLEGNTLVNDYTWSFTTASADNTAPTVITVSPLDGATGVNINTTITASFSEAINGTTVTSSTVQLKDAGNNVIPAGMNIVSNQVILTPSAPLANSTVYSVTITGGVSGVKDLAGNALDDDFTWMFTTGALADNIPPTVATVSPINNATGININATVTANFSEAVNSPTVTGTTFQLKAGSTVIPATVNTASNQITLTPTSALANSTTYTVTIKGGGTGVKDLAGNALVNDYVWSFTTAAASGGGSTASIFQPTDAPDSRSNDGQGIALGVKFRSTQDGFITGVRYYKPAGTTGTHTGQLWSNGGTMLAQATFTNETASGWQDVLFASPVAITAGVTYVASYYSPSGDFAASGSYFTQAVVNGPLRALADGEDGVNGLYKYSATPVFPTNGYEASNYWADVIFTAGSATDITPPTLVSESPADAATDISTVTSITAGFNEPIDAATINGTTVQLTDALNNVIPATVNVNAASDQIVMTPISGLAPLTEYTVTIQSDITDIAGNTLASDITWSFTTGAGTLPILLHKFSVTQNGPVNLVKWTTELESDIEYFELERSTNGLDFQPINRQAANNTPGTSHYSFADKGFSPGVNYYRLKIVEHGAIIQYSVIVRAVAGDERKELRITPNPVTRNFYLTYHSLEEDNITVEIKDIAGRLVHTLKENVNKGQNAIYIKSSPGWHSGVYFIIVKSKNETKQAKFVIAR